MIEFLARARDAVLSRLAGGRGRWGWDARRDGVGGKFWRRGKEKGVVGGGKGEGAVRLVDERGWFGGGGRRVGWMVVEAWF